MRNNYFRHLFAALLLLCTTMAAGAQTHTLTYRVDGQVYQTCSLAAGEAISHPAAPSKANYTFLGWSTSSNLNEIDLANNANDMLYSNAPCKTDQYGDQFVGWHVLFDNDPSTFFHSDYSGADSEDSLDHYIRVDMGEGKQVSIFTFGFTTRSSNSNINSPKVIVVEGSDEAFGEYETIATLTNLPSENSAEYESGLLGNGNAYRYVRFRVTATQQNQMKGGHPFFFMSEINMYEVEPAPAVMPDSDLTLYARYKSYSCDIEQDGIFYRFFDVEARTVKVTSCQSSLNGYSGTLDIPATVTHNGEEYTVVGAEEGVFSAGNITSISIPSTFGVIGSKLLASSTSIESVVLEEGITAIEDMAFYGCTALKSISIPATVTTIGSSAFYGCDALSNIVIPESITEIEFATFHGCYSLTSIVIPDNVTTIGEWAFNNCTGLADITIGSGVTTIGYNAFKNLPALTSLVIPDNVTTIGEQSFYYCSNLASVTIGSGVTSIGVNAFSYCSNLKTVVNLSSLTFEAGGSDYGKIALYADKVVNAPDGTMFGDFLFTTVDGVNTLAAYFGDGTELVLPANYNGENYVIGENAFAGCASIESLTIPAAVTSIGNGAFSGCTALANLTIEDSENPLVLGANTVVGDLVETTLFCDAPLETLYMGRNLEYNRHSTGSTYTSPFERERTLTSLTIGDKVTGIPWGAFIYCTGLTEVVIPNNVTMIDYYAFLGCSGITNFVMGTSVEYLGDYSLCGCSGLTELVIPEGVSRICRQTLWNCDNLVSISIPASVTTIDDGAFRYCPSLANVRFEDGEDTLVLGCNITSEDESVYGEGLFYGCPLETLYIGRNLEYPTDAPNGWSPFNRIVTLTDVTFGNTVTTIGDNLFGSCRGLRNATIPSSVTRIDNGAFGNNQNSLESVFISDLAAWCRIDFGTADSNPLYQRANLYLNGELVTDLVVPAGITEVKCFAFTGCQSITTLVVPEGVTTVGCEAFCHCYNLADIQLPETLTTLYFGAFSRTGIETISFPAAVTELPDWIVDNCQNLTEVELPATLTYIGQYAFAGCNNLTSISIPGTVTSIRENAFENCSVLKTVINFSNLTFTAGSEDYGYIALNADKVINARGGSMVGDYVFTTIDDVNTLVGYIGNATDIVLPENFNGNGYEIGATAFAGDTNLTSLTIPAAVTAVETDAFLGCTGLNAVYIDNLAAWCNIDFQGVVNSNPLQYAHNLYVNGELLTELVIPDGITGIKNETFRGCNKITSLTIPEGVTTIGQYAFNTCTALTRVTFPESLTTLRRGAFSGCISLETVVLPAAVTELEYSVFMACSSLADITSLATTPPAIVNGSCTNIAENATLYVPRDCGAAYAATEWSQIPNIVELAFNLVYKVNGTVYATERIDYGAAVTPIDDPEVPGYTFVEWEGLPEYMPRHDVEVNAVLEMSAIAITISKYGSATYSSQYALDFSEVEGLKAYAATGYNTESGEITMTRVKTTNAGDGIYLAGEPNTTYYVPFIDHSNNHSLNLLVGTLKKTMVNTYSDDGSYVNYRYGVATGETTPKFFRYSDGSTCGAGKAYLQIPTAWFAGMASETVGIRFEEGELTDIDEVTDASVDETIVYDLNGRRIADVDNLEKGIYIINGKKVLVK